MLPREVNELLTRTPPKAPAGELLRRYWQPAALSEELPPGGPPLPVRLLGEDLVLFRDQQGTPGLLGLHCSHRGADLSYGRLEDGGLRCIYHGWLYDVHGRCLDQPGEPEGSRFFERIRHPAYPCQEVAGLILTYLGPGEPPLIPAYDLLVGDGHRFATKVYRECNYLQGNEGNIDSVHLAFLHRQQSNPGVFTTTIPYGGFDIIEVEEAPFGVRNYWIRKMDDEQMYVHITSFGMPNLGFFGGGRGDGMSLNWHVPIDDEHHWEYVVNYRRTDPLDERMSRQSHHAELGPDYRPIRNRANRYLQDRDEMKTSTFSGLGSYFYAHDACATETPGPIQDRTQEHLGVSDRAIVAARTMLLRGIKDVQEGRDPPHVVRDPAENHFADLVIRGEVIPSSCDWRTYWKEAPASSGASA